jgi:hypothetical protein
MTAEPEQQRRCGTCANYGPQARIAGLGYCLLKCREDLTCKYFYYVEENELDGDCTDWEEAPE